MATGFNHLAINAAVTPNSTTLTNLIALGQTGMIIAFHLHGAALVAAGSAVNGQLVDAGGTVFFSRGGFVNGTAAAVNFAPSTLAFLPQTQIPFTNGLAIRVVSLNAGDSGNVWIDLDYLQL